MSKLRKIISLILSLLMIISIMPVTDISVFASETDDILTYLTYEISDGEVTIVGCDTSISGDVVIPDEIEGYPVTAINTNVFYRCERLTSITIPDGIISIGDCAFGYCHSLVSITIPDSVTLIGSVAFESCTSLESITVSENNQYYSSDGYGVLFNKDKTELIQYPAGNSRTAYIIPNSVTSIEEYAFFRCESLESITIPDSVITIGNGSFCDCTSLTSITIPNGVTSISNNALASCTSLKSITIPNSVISIGDYAFASCSSLESITIPNSVTSIGNWAFYYCTSLKSITIPDSVTAIEYEAFYYCTSLESITVDENNLYYSNDEYGVLFDKDKTELIQYPTGNSRTSYIIPDSVTSIGDYVFYECTSLESITIPDSVTSIGDWAFYYCTSLKSITIPDSVTVIGYETFYYCKSLKSITIPDSVTTIYYQAFYDCTSLESITILNPDCKIYDLEDTIYSGTTIYGYADSTAQEYAEKYDRSFVAIEPEAVCTHNYIGVVTAPTCTKKGYTTYTCSICGDSYVSDDTAVAEHSLKHVTVASTCAVAGSEYDKCTVCGSKVNNKSLSLADHTYGKWTTTKAPTCSGSGVKVRVCSVCTKEESGTVPANGHNYKHKTVASTCAVAGREYDECTVCGSKVNNKSLPLADHTYGKWTTSVEATCTEKGLSKRVCTACKAEETTEISATGHDYTAVVTAPTCAEKGYTTYTCSVCSDSYVADYTETTGHSYGDWVVTKDATFINGGEETRTCTACSATETRETEKLVATNEFVNEDTGVSITVTDDTYEDDIVVEVTQVFDGTSFQIINAQIGNFAATVFDISTTLDGEKVQPNGTVLIKMPIPEGYSTDSLVIYYLPNDGSAPEKMDSYIEGTYICFETTHFSEYAIIDESEELPAYIPGDVNNDGKITAADARLALRISAQLEKATETLLLVADVSGDGKVTAADARTILRVAANLDSFK